MDIVENKLKLLEKEIAVMNDGRSCVESFAGVIRNTVLAIANEVNEIEDTQAKFDKLSNGLQTVIAASNLFKSQHSINLVKMQAKIDVLNELLDEYIEAGSSELAQEGDDLSQE